MRLKHWQGYGHIDAFLKERTRNYGSGDTTIIIEVQGNHEYGLDRSEDKYTIFNWILKRFDKNVKDMNDRIIKSVSFDYLPSVRIDGCSVERGQYTISYNY